MSLSTTASDQQQYIIAIGASAGGLQEINSFFDHTPLDGISYIIIQHLSGDYKSMMASLLSNHSKLNVCEAKDNMLVEANKVYLIPSTDYMTIHDGRLLLTEKQKTGAPHLTINTFFNSLALDIGKKAIGVVLSGTGTDGTKGSEAIKNAGGMIMASDPEKAEYNEMPLSVISTGLVDYVLAPAEMPDIIQNYVAPKHNGVADAVENEKEEKARTAIINFIKEHFPHDFSDYKSSTILRRIKRRALANNMNSLDLYFNFLKTDHEEAKVLSHDFLISVTSFFRDKEAFEFLETDVIPDIIHHKSNYDELKVWVAGCATGEEAYSLAILINEGLKKANKNTVVKIFATDIDNIALNYAKNGFYGDHIVNTVSPERLEQFFTKEDKGYKIKEHIRRMLIFANHDLVKNPPYCNMDIISCRNLLIYLNQNLQKKILGMLQFGLRKDGYLILGSSENIPDKSTYIEEVNKKWKIYKILEARRNISFDVFSPQVLSESKAIPGTFTKYKENKTSKEDLKEYFNETLISELGYTGVCIDENKHVVQTFGDISKYVLPKMFNFDLNDILPKPLAIAFKNASHDALKTNKKVIVNGIRTEHNKRVLSINLVVIPFTIKKTGQQLMMVFFEDAGLPADAGKEPVVFDEKVYANQYILNLEDELKQAKESLHEVFEKLDASNENMQSFNEELLSTNEEMQSTNEEMQSVNEELHTINAEYQTKIKELSDLNDDLNNYFRSNENGQLFVNKQLLLMKFSPSAVKHINLLDTDIGRPISNISSNIKNETLENDAKEVIDNGGVITKEVEANNGKWYQMMTMPYIREKDKKIDGAIITFNDITELKKVQTELDKSNKTLTTINADLDNFVYSASHDLLGPLSNLELIISLVDDRKEEFDEEINKYLLMMKSAVSKFKTIISDLAVVGKIESDLFEKDPIDLTELIDEIKLSMADNIVSANATISTDLNITSLRFSKKNLRSILYNLLTNAIKFRRVSRTLQIHISTRLAEGYVILSVQDNGLGISAENIDGIFTIYERIHQHIIGQGIGLYLLKKIVDASGGKVVVKSEVDKGSTFEVYFKI